jgi:hypothetical protein
LIREQNSSIVDLWDGTQLKCSFRRSVDKCLMDKWYKIIHITESIVFTNEEDSLIWKFENKGVYTVSSMYVVTNFRYVTPVHIPSLWN